MSINNDQHIDTNVENYSPSELFQILNIENPTVENIQSATSKMVEQFEGEGNTELVNFFKDAETRMLDAIPPENSKDLVNFDNKYNSQNTGENQMGQWWEHQNLVQSDTTQSDKTTERKQRIGMFDNIHNTMKRSRLGINQTHSVPVVQGQMNPNLKNTCTRLVNIDSQFRQNSFPAKNGLPYNQISSPHTSTYSSTDFTVDLTDTLHNVLSLKLYSVSIPYTWYTFDVAYGTDCFLVKCNDKYFPVTIPSGNYNLDKDDDDGYIINVINNAWNTASITLPNNDVVTLKSCYLNDNTDINPFSYNHQTGKVTFTVPDNWTNWEIYWYVQPDELDDDITDACGSTCGIGKKANSNLGYLLGFRNSTYNDTDLPKDDNGNIITPKLLISEGIINLYGPRYLMLILDDYNQNHLNKGLVAIQDTAKIADLPSYYDPNLPCVNTVPDPSQGVLQSYPSVIADGPRKLTKAKRDTINSIMKDRKQTTSTKLKSVTDSDMFALIPLKKSITTQVGEGLTEFSGPIQVNERIYFGPVDIDRLRIRLVTDKGDTLNLNGNDWSFCMIAEVLYQY